MAVLREEKKKMINGDPVRKTKTHKPAEPKKASMKLIRKTLPNRKERRQKNKLPRLDWTGFGYGTSKNTGGTFGKGPLEK